MIAQLNLALALDGAGEPETAHEIICHFEDKNVIPASLWARLAGICYSVKDFKRAWKFAERAIEGGLGVGRATNLKAKLMIDAGEFDAAEALLRANLFDAWENQRLAQSRIDQSPGCQHGKPDLARGEG